MASTTSAPKYTVSFNSDTSDSEEESSTENETESEDTEEEVPVVVKQTPVEPSPVEEMPNDNDTAAEFTFDISYDSNIVNGVLPSPTESPTEDAENCSGNFEFTFSVETDTNELKNTGKAIKTDIQNGTGSASVSKDIQLAAEVIGTDYSVDGHMQQSSASGHKAAESGLGETGSEPTAEFTLLAASSTDNKSTCPGPGYLEQGATSVSKSSSSSSAASIEGDLTNTIKSPSTFPTTSEDQDKLSTDSSKKTNKDHIQPNFAEQKEETMTINTEVEVEQSVTIETGDNGRGENTQAACENNAEISQRPSDPPDEVCQSPEHPNEGDLEVVLEEGEKAPKEITKNMNEEDEKGDGDLICLDDNLPLPKPQTKANDEPQSIEQDQKDRQRGFTSESSKTMDKASDRVAKTRLSKTKSLPESPILSPKYKSIADDDFEARISRAKAFIESSNGRFSTSEDKSKGKSNSNSSNVSTTSSQQDDKELSENAEDQYVLGMVAVTTGDKSMDTTADTLTISSMERSKRRKEDLDDIDSRVRDISESTNELIKRILAEARGEKYEPPETKSRDDNRTEEKALVEDTDDYGSYSSKSRHPQNDEMGSMSLLERRIESMKKRNAELASDNYGAKPKRYNTFGTQQAAEDDSGMQMVLYDASDSRSTTSSRAESIRKKYRENWGHQQHYEGDDEVFTMHPDEGALVPYTELDDDEDDNPFKARRALMRQFVLPDEAFVPRKSEDTDDIVKERTTDIRNVVNKQENVLEELRKASQSFDEIEDEIKEIRQMFYESQERRAMIHEEIEYDLQVAKQNEEALAAQAFARRYAPLPEVDYTRGILPSQAPLALTWHKEHADEDMDDTASVSSHRGLAISRASGWTGPGTRLTSSISLDQGRDTFETDSYSSLPSYRAKARPSSASRKFGRSMYDRSRTRSLMEDYDNPSDVGDDRMSRDDDGDTLDGMDDHDTAPSWRQNQKMNGDASNAWRSRDPGHDEEDVEVSDELRAKINSWRAKNESEEGAETGEEGPSFRAQVASWRSYNNPEDTESGATRMPMQNGYDSSLDTSGYSSLRNRGKTGYGLNSAEECSHNPYRLFNGEDASSATPSWRSRQDDNASDTGAYSWRSKYGLDQDNTAPKYSWQQSSSALDKNTGGYQSGRYNRYGKTYSMDDTDTNTTYTSPYTSSTSRFSRSSTLSDYDFPRPDRRARARSCEPVGFKSKFLDKVREQRASGEGGSSSTSGEKTRSKPFKSRFLRSSFGAESSSTDNKAKDAGAE